MELLKLIQQERITYQDGSTGTEVVSAIDLVTGCLVIVYSSRVSSTEKFSTFVPGVKLVEDAEKGDDWWKIVPIDC